MLWWHRWRFRAAQRKLDIFERAVALGYRQFDTDSRMRDLRRALAWHGAHIAASEIAKAKVVRGDR